MGIYDFLAALGCYECQSRLHCLFIRVGATLDLARFMFDATSRGERMTASIEFRKQINGYGLTTAEILYHMPDHPALLQSYIWQEYDLFPEFPVLHRFLDFWAHTLDGVLHSVTVGHARLIRPAELKAVGASFKLN
jgi:uncharacterized protein Usg